MNNEITDIIDDIKGNLRQFKVKSDLINKILLNTYYTSPSTNSYNIFSLYDENIEDEIRKYGSKLLYEYTENIARGL